MTSKTEIRLKKYSQMQNAENELNSAKEKIEAKILLVCDNVQEFLKNALPFVKQCRAYYEKYCNFGSNRMLLFKGKAEAASFSYSDFEQVMSKCSKYIISASENLLNTESEIREFCLSYNTLLLLLGVKNKLIENAIKTSIRVIQNKIDSYRAELSEFDDPQWQKIYTALKNNDQELAIDLINNDMNSVYCEGNIVYGTKNDLKIFSQSIDIPVFLQATQKENAIFIKMEDEKQTSEMLDVFLPGLFEKVALSYRPGNFYFAFAEENNISHVSCGLFSNLIKDVQKEDQTNKTYKLINCLYKVSDFQCTTSGELEKDEYILGNAATADGISKLLKSICNELNRRKTNNRLKDKTIFEYNEENRDEMLPYIILVVNTYSKVFDDSKFENEYENLQALINNGGQFGIFVICVGRNIEISSIDFDLISNFDCVVEYSNGANKIELLKSNNNKDSLFAEWKSKCEKASSMLLSSITERTNNNNFTLPLFANNNGIIAIPIGISNGKVFSFKINNKIGNSTIITGTSGSGKTTFIRTLIMSAAYYYSPDQVQFYIIDFKSASGTADFACFSQDGGNAYVPHIRFLSAKSGEKQALSLLEYVESIVQYRSSLFTKYSNRKGIHISEAPQYRIELQKEIENARCNNYAEYLSYTNNAGEEAMPMLPQIFVIIDEANTAFSDNCSIRLIDELDNSIRRIRSFGISFILCGQNNPITKQETLGNIGNRIAFAAGSPLLYYKTFTSRNLPEIEDGNSFLSGRQGKAVFQFNSQEVLSFANTAYLSHDELSNFAKAINDKYKNIYDWTQQQPGSTAIVSANELIKEINNFDSDINNRWEEYERKQKVIPIYVGMNSLYSAPYPILLGAPDGKADQLRQQNNEENAAKHNWLAYLSPEKQVRLFCNMGFYFVYYCKRSNVSFNISLNYPRIDEYSPSGKQIKDLGGDLLNQHKSIIDDSGLRDDIQVNESVNDIIRSLQECHDIYSKRKNGSINSKDRYPYLFCLGKLEQLFKALENQSNKKGEEIAVSEDSDVNKSNIPLSDAIPIEELPKGFIDNLRSVAKESTGTEDVINKYLTDAEKLDTLFNHPYSPLPRQYHDLAKKYNQLKEVRNKQKEQQQAKKEQTPTPEKIDVNIIAKQLEELLNDGAEQNVFVVCAYRSTEIALKMHKIQLENWKNKISEGNDEKSEGNDNLCNCKETEIRLYDYTQNAIEWRDFIIKEQNKNERRNVNEF